MSTAGLILAAGAGRRFGAPKAEVMVGGRRLLDRAAEVLTDAGCSPVFAVVRSSDVLAAGVRCVVNPDTDTGMASSLRLGIAAAAQSSAEACVIVLVDLLGITAADVRAVMSASRADAAAEVVVTRRAGRRSHPVLVTRGAFAEFAASATGDEGGRSFIDALGERVRFVDAADVLVDLDTREDLRSIDGRAFFDP